MTGNTAVMVVLVPDQVQGPGLDLALALAAEDGTTSSKVLPRYKNICVKILLLFHVSFDTCFLTKSPLNGKRETNAQIKLSERA